MDTNQENEEEIRLTMTFTVEQMNIILKALSKEPFKDVFQLIGHINEQAATQLSPENE